MSKANKAIRYFTPGRLIIWFLVLNGLVLAVGALLSPGEAAAEYRWWARIWKANVAGFAGLFCGRLLFELGSGLTVSLRLIGSALCAAIASAAAAYFSQWIAIFTDIEALVLRTDSSLPAALGAAAIAIVLSAIVLPLWLSAEQPAAANDQPTTPPSAALSGESHRLQFRERRRPTSLAADEIVYAEARGKRCTLHTIRSQHLLAETLAQVEARLPAAEFVRIHKSFLVRVDCIGALQSGRDGARLRLQGEGDEELPVGRAYVSALRERLAQMPRD